MIKISEIDKYIHFLNKKNRYHRINYPAVIDYYRITNRLDYKSYWKNNKLHNEFGPARIWSCGYEEYYLNDEKTKVKSLEDFLNIVQEQKELEFYL